MYSVYLENDKKSVLEFIKMIDNYSIINENEIWIFDDNTRYPCLSMLIANNNVIVHYFKNDLDVGSISYNKKFKENNEYVSFNDICLGKQYVIDRKIAIECIKQFVINGERPSCINWFDL